MVARTSDRYHLLGVQLEMQAPSGSKKTRDLNMGCQNKLSKESPKLRLDLPKNFYRLGLRS